MLLTIRNTVAYNAKVHRDMTINGNSKERKEEIFMYKINTFLPKRKMQESSHGLAMVVIAYLLAIVMLFVGSDSFYSISSHAAGKAGSEEEIIWKDMDSQGLDNQTLNNQGLGNQAKTSKVSTNTILQQPKLLYTNLIDPYRITADAEKNNVTGNLEQEQSNISKDLTEDNLSKHESKEAKKEAKKETKKEAKAKDAEGTIETLSVIEEAQDNYVVRISDEEMEMLERIVEAEATGEDLKGKILVANVVINRVKNKEFPDTIEEVIYQKVDGDYQFSPLSDKRFWKVKVTKETKKAVISALEGKDYSKGALYFMARKQASKTNVKWFDSKLKWLFQHGVHEFYKNK